MVQVGDIAPDFTLNDQHGRRVSLSAQVGPALVVFFPAAFTPVCHDELRELATIAEEMNVVAMSCDSMHVLRALADAEGFDFLLLSDFWPHGEVARAYDAFDEVTGMSRRVSVLVDERGGVSARWESPAGQARDAADYLRALAELRRG
jgi:peroxiredoxin